MNLRLTGEAVKWFFNREHCPYEDVAKARLICDMRMNGSTYREIGNRVGLCKDRVRQYVYRVQRTYDRAEARRNAVESGQGENNVARRNEV